MLFSALPSKGTTKVWVKSSVAIKNGKRDGTIEFAHKFKPDLELVKFDFENTIIKIINRQKIAGKIVFLSFTTIKFALFNKIT